MNPLPLADRSGWMPESIAVAAHAHGDAGPDRTDPAQRMSIGEMLAAVRRNRVLMGGWFVACLAFAALYLASATPEFLAFTQVVLEPRPLISPGAEASGGLYGPVLDSAQADSQIQVIKSERNLRFVFDTLDLANDPLFAGPDAGLVNGLLAFLIGRVDQTAPRSAVQADLVRARAFQAFSNRVAVRRVGQSYVLEVSFWATSPDLAAHYANSITAAYILDQVRFKAASVQRGTEFLQTRIADIKAEQDIAIQAVKTGIIPDAQFADSDARIVGAAVAPLVKSYPQTGLLLLLAGAFGLLSGGGLVALRVSLDRTVRSREQLTRALRVDHISVLPDVRVRTGMRVDRSQLAFTAVLDDPDGDFARALRMLPTAIGSIRSDSRRLALGIVSWAPREGRSAVAANLAFLLASSQERVALIDGDLENPALTKDLAPDAGAGLADLLLSRGLQPFPPTIALARDVSFLPAARNGDAIDHPPFLGSVIMQQLLKAMQSDRSIVVDLPPLSRSADALALGPLLDGVVLLVETNRTTIEEVIGALRTLRVAKVRVLSIVINKGA